MDKIIIWIEAHPTTVSLIILISTIISTSVVKYIIVPIYKQKKEEKEKYKLKKRKEQKTKNINTLCKIWNERSKK